MRYRCGFENVDADMAELESDRERIHCRKKWRQNVMKRKSNHIGKRDFEPIITGLSTDLLLQL